MNRKPVCLWILFSLFVIHQSRASDTTYHKKPVYLSVSAGYTSNRAFGSLVTEVQDFNTEFGLGKMQQKNKGGFAINVGLELPLSSLFYLKTGLGYIQKQVNPEEHAYPLYKDSLKTGYLSIPILFGFQEALNSHKTIFFFANAGPSGSFRVVDKSYSGPDRVSFKPSFAVLGFQGGAGLKFVSPTGMGWVLQYNYSTDLTKAYAESLYIGTPSNPIQKFEYKFATQTISIGMQWAL